MALFFPTISNEIANFYFYFVLSILSYIILHFAIRYLLLGEWKTGRNELVVEHGNLEGGSDDHVDARRRSDVHRRRHLPPSTARAGDATLRCCGITLSLDI